MEQDVPGGQSSSMSPGSFEISRLIFLMSGTALGVPTLSIPLIRRILA
jgi:hypothetical protein